LAPFQASLLARAKSLRLPGPDEYYGLLESDTAPAEREWPELTSRLTNRESYFFRDKGQMALLRDRILPELIQRNRAQRSLRLWSAGCSTGEEAYSLAMLVEDLLPQRERWQVFIHGTDLNPQVLAHAERGIYGAWSFRMVEPLLQQRHFQPVTAGWQISESLRSRVTFSPSNLVRDPFPDPAAGLCEMDLILCRNVFIYFERTAIPAVVRKLADTLREGGYLLTGHAEIEYQSLEGLQLRRFPEALVYQRVIHCASLAAPQLPASPTEVATEPRGSSEATYSFVDGPWPSAQSSEPVDGAAGSPLPDLAEALYPQGEYDALIARLEPLLERQPGDYASLYLLSQAYTNQGRYAQAVAVCRKASELNPMAPAPYQLLAALVEDQGDYDQAKDLLKKVIYSSPTYAPAYVELGSLYAREGEPSRARKMWTTALELLRHLPPEAALLPWGGPLAGEWVRHVESQLGEGA